MISQELLDGRIVFILRAFTLLYVILLYQRIGLLRREITIDRGEHGKHLARIQRYIVATGLHDAGKVAELLVAGYRLPYRCPTAYVGLGVIVVVPCIRTACNERQGTEHAKRQQSFCHRHDLFSAIIDIHNNCPYLLVVSI